MLGQGKPKESIGSQLHLGRHPALEGVGSWSELLMCRVAPTQGHLVRSYGPVVDKPLREGDWTGVLSSNDACGLSHSHPKWWPDSAWPGREEINIETTAIREFLSMLASGGGLSSGSPAAASDRPSRLILIWLYL